MKPYQPVSCDIHSQYELFIMHATPLFLKYRDPLGNELSMSATAIDLQTSQGEEYLLLQPRDNEPLSIRLDYILECRADTKHL